MFYPAEKVKIFCVKQAAASTASSAANSAIKSVKFFVEICEICGNFIKIVFLVKNNENFVLIPPDSGIICR
jgi:hypothetical protein